MITIKSFFLNIVLDGFLYLLLLENISLDLWRRSDTVDPPTFNIYIFFSPYRLWLNSRLSNSSWYKSINLSWSKQHVYTASPLRKEDYGGNSLSSHTASASELSKRCQTPARDWYKVSYLTSCQKHHDFLVNIFDILLADSFIGCKLIQ